jgi:hypothetical protein
MRFDGPAEGWCVDYSARLGYSRSSTLEGQLSKFKEALESKIKKNLKRSAISGFIGQDGAIYPLGSDTKVLSTIFELITRPAMLEIADEHGLELIEPSVQNHYPDFTLCSNRNSKKKIAIDVKTTYITHPEESFGFTLGGYTSFIRPDNETKNIVFPFSEYSEHWVIGYVYERLAEKKAAEQAVYTIDGIKKIPLPYSNVRFYVQEKWKISGDRAGSGNTTNIGSITGKMDAFQSGKGVFKNEKEFLDYWRNYGRTSAERGNFKNITEYRAWRKVNPV